MTRLRSDLARFAMSLWGRAVISLVLLGLILTQVDLVTAADRLRDADRSLFVGAIALNGIALVFGSLRWHEYLRAAAVPVGRRQAAEGFFAGAFSSLALPTTLAGDVVRGWRVAPAGQRARVFATILVDRATVLGCALLVGWGAVALAAGNGALPRRNVVALALATTVFAVGISAIYGTAAVGRRLRAHVPVRIVDLGRAAMPAVRSGFSGTRVVVVTLALGICYQLLVFTGTWLVARSLSISVSLALVAASAPAVLMLSTIPVSLGGLGVREASWVALLAPSGVDVTDATLLSLLGTAAFLVPTVPGGLLLLRDWRRPAQVAPD